MPRRAVLSGDVGWALPTSRQLRSRSRRRAAPARDVAYMAATAGLQRRAAAEAVVGRRNKELQKDRNHSNALVMSQRARK